MSAQNADGAARRTRGSVVNLKNFALHNCSDTAVVVDLLPAYLAALPADIAADFRYNSSLFKNASAYNSPLFKDAANYMHGLQNVSFHNNEGGDCNTALPVPR